MDKLPLVDSLQNVSNILFGLAVSGHQIPQDQLNGILAVTARQDLLDRALPQEISNIIWSAATMDWCLEQQQLQHLVACLLSKLADAKPQEVSNTLWAVATIQQRVSDEQLEHLIAGLISKLANAKPQDVSNTLWAVATIQQSVSDEQLEQLVACLISKLADAKPQEVSNTLWAVATMQQSVSDEQLEHLVACLISKLADAKPQHLSNTLWAVASMQQSVSDEQLEHLVAGLISKLADAKPQDVSITLWAVATMQQSVSDEQLEHLVACLISKLADAKPQEVTNTLWACGEMRCFPQQLLPAMQEQRAWQALLPAMKPRELGQMGIALGALGHRDNELMAAVLQQANECMQQQHTADIAPSAVTSHSEIESSSSSSLVWTSCNLCWSVAVLDMQQHIPDVLTLLQFCAKHFERLKTEGLQQQQQVHLWLKDVRGLSSVLADEQLIQCKAAWDRKLQEVAARNQLYFQTEVFATVQQLPLTWSSDPVMEQLAEPDGNYSIDISGVTAAGERLAIEADGPTHFRRPDNGLTGSTMSRNRALAARGYVVVSVPWYEWQELKGSNEKQQYLMDQLQQQLVVHKGMQHNQQPVVSKVVTAAAAPAGRRRKRKTS